jgi:hypothetical protein
LTVIDWSRSQPSMLAAAAGTSALSRAAKLCIETGKLLSRSAPGQHAVDRRQANARGFV